ncbi:MAG: NAD(P)/FAD-dependent oxidoreductase [Clostridiales bacterium]|jgi:predicted Rossmann fold flavoprotein|nr:NAD(P)/FAD-dependent oxidoreductase [Clostridiales bacterium]
MRVIVVGGGPAGMMAAITASEQGHTVTLIEKNEKLGKKLYITGKGRCNITNAGGKEAFFENIIHNPRFLFSAYSAYSSADVISLMHALGVPTKVERGDRVFPQSDKSSDVIRALAEKLRRCGVEVVLNAQVSDILVENGHVAGVLAGKPYTAGAVILSTGGMSYPSTGSTGDGYAFASKLGHTVIPPLPALVPLQTKERWPKDLSGLSLKNITLRAVYRGRTVYRELGEMLFTHFGASGPLVLSASSYLPDNLQGVTLLIDLKPGLTAKQLEKRLIRDIEAHNRQNMLHAFSALAPKSLLPILFEIAAIDASSPASVFTRKQRAALISVLKALPLTVEKTRPFDEAIITRRGVSTKEVDASTMESKLIKGLYFAGELLDVDAATGGFNLQIAWSTGRLAGRLGGFSFRG